MPPQPSDEEEEPQPPTQSKPPIEVAGDHRGHGPFELERADRVHEHIEKRRTVIGSNKPKYRVDLPPVLSLVRAQRPRAEIVVLECGVDRLRCILRRAHGHENPGRKNGVDKGGGVADDEKTVADELRGLVGEVGNRMDRLDLLGPGHRALQGVGFVDGPVEIALEVVAMLSDHLFGDDRPDTGDAVCERNDPEPVAVPERNDSNVSRVISGIAVDAAEVAEEGESVTLGVHPLQLEAAREKRLLAAGYDITLL